MEVGSSQAATTTQDSLHQLPRKERKPRHKLKKGKEREEGGHAAAEAPGHSNGVLVEGINADETWAWASLADASVSNRPPVFANSCRYFFLIAGSSVKIYATATGEVVSTLSSSSSGSASSSSQMGDGHTDEITAAFVHPQNAFQLMTASLDGRIKIWDYLEAALLSTIEVGEPITHMCAHEHVRDHVFVATSSHKRHNKSDANVLKEQSKVYRVSLRPSRATVENTIHKPADIQKVGKMRATTGLAISPSGAWLVATGGPKAYVCPTTSLSSGFTKFVSNEILTCLAFHPSEEYFATGDQKGQIRLWYCLNPAQISSRSQGEKRAQTTTLHWHAHAVSSIAFTANGSYLLSGGEEAVLVIWQLHTGKKEFVPRVGAPIVSVAVASHQSAEEEFLLVLSDGTLAVVGSGTLRVSRSFSRIKHNPNSWSSGPAPLAVHARTSTVILPSSHPSSLLTYAPLTSTLVAELEISASNRVSRRDEKPIEASRVDHAVISYDGEWLATIDGREGSDDFERETYMKIWQWDAASSAWNLNSRIDRPHGVHRVHDLTFAPAGDRSFLVSTGDDGNVKVWRVKTVSTKKGEHEVYWVCRSTLAYRSGIPTNAVCSPDGSLLAVAHGRHVVVYELLNNALRTVLTCPELKEIFHIAFIGSSGRYVAVGGRRAVVVWDLVTSTVQWRHSFPSRVNHVISHPKDDTFIVMYRGDNARPTAIRRFNIASASPVSERTLPFKLRKVVWYPYTASGGDFTLVGITQQWTSVVLGDRVHLRQDKGSLAREISGDNSPYRKNLFQDIFGASAFQNFSSQPPATLPSRDGAITGPIKPSNPLNTPAYLLPPLHTLYTPLLESLLQKRDAQPTPEAREEHEQVEDEDAIMEDTPRENTAGRVLQDVELDEFVELFKQQMFSSAKISAVACRPTGHLNGNGIAKSINGTQHRKTPTSVTHTPTPINGKNHPPKRPSEQVELAQESSPPAVGKKRKKSMA